MANTQSLWSNKRDISRKRGSIEVDIFTMVNAKLDSLSKRIDKMTVNVVSTSPLSSFCELCQGRYPTFECHLMQNLSIENISYMSNFNGQQQNIVHGNAYNPSWRNHPNFSWNNQGNNQWRPQIPLSFGGQNAQQPQSHF